MTIKNTFSSLLSPAILLIAFLAAAGRTPEPPKKPAHKADIPRTSVAGPRTLQFADVTQSSGIRFVHKNGAFGKKYLPEALGPGCAFIDYDNDGYPDILLINGKGWPGHETPDRNTLKLYRNNRDGSFTDVTAKSGLGLIMYGMGAAIGDYDNDGFDDIFITA